MNIRIAAIFGLAATITASCTSTPVQEVRSPRAQKQLTEALAGRAPGPPVNCLPNWRTTQMEIVDDYTILFRDGRTVYVQNPQGGCNGIGSGAYTLVTRQFGVNQMCRGDINRLIDLRTGMGGGSCVFSPFIPYTRTN